MQIRKVPNLTPKHRLSYSWPMRKAQPPAAAARNESASAAPPRWLIFLAE